jgi:hypothetical protein
LARPRPRGLGFLPGFAEALRIEQRVHKAAAWNFSDQSQREQRSRTSSSRLKRSITSIDRSTPRLVTRRSSAIAFSASFGAERKRPVSITASNSSSSKGSQAMSQWKLCFISSGGLARYVARSLSTPVASKPSALNAVTYAAWHPSQPPRGGENAGDRLHRHQVFALLERVVERAMDRARGRPGADNLSRTPPTANPPEAISRPFRKSLLDIPGARKRETLRRATN